MTTTLTVEVAFDTYKPGDTVTLPDTVAQVLLKSYPGRYAFTSNSNGSGGQQSQPTTALSTTAVYASGVVSGVVSGPAGAVGGLVVRVYLDGSATSSLSTTTASNGSWSIPIAVVGNHTFEVSIETPALTGTIIGPAAVLAVLSLSLLNATAGQPFLAGIVGQTSGSQVTATSSDGTILAVANGQVTGTFTVAGKPNLTLTETLAGATGSPKQTVVAVTVGSSGLQADFSNPNNSGLAGAL